jgi:AcrR family transcriptional regulator
MARIVDTVNMPYHHGNLRPALVDAAEGLARAGGPEEVGLRAVARAAGVSHNAAYRHFADHDELLREVGKRCMSHLAERMEQAVAALPPVADPVEAAWRRLEVIGRAYVEFGVAEPGWFRTAFGVPPSVEGLEPDAGKGGRGLSPFELLSEALDGLVEVGAMSAGQRAGAEFPAWAAVHGFTELLLDGPLRTLAANEREPALAKVLSVVTAGLGGHAPTR